MPGRRESHSKGSPGLDGRGDRDTAYAGEHDPGNLADRYVSQRGSGSDSQVPSTGESRKGRLEGVKGFDAVAEAIEDIFGFGAKLLEIRIMKNLFRKIGHGFTYLHTQEGLEFAKYIESARTKYATPFALVSCTQQTKKERITRYY